MNYDENEDDEFENREKQSQNKNNTTATEFDKILKEKIQLNDGSEEFLFARGPKYFSEWPFNCFLCRKSNLNNTEFKDHLNDKEHKNNLEKARNELLDANNFRKPIEQKFSKQYFNPIKIYPGEIIAKLTSDQRYRLMPLVEEILDDSVPINIREALLDDELHKLSETMPILGLSYVLKMIDSAGYIKYFCGMCKGAIFGEHNIHQHMIGYNHYMKFIRWNWWNFYKKIESRVIASKLKQSLNYLSLKILRYFYRQLEEWKGLQKIQIVDYKKFIESKVTYWTKIKSHCHYHEDMIKFSENEILDAIAEFKVNKNIVRDLPQFLENQPRTEDQCKNFFAIDEETKPASKLAWLSYRIDLLKSFGHLNEEYITRLFGCKDYSINFPEEYNLYQIKKTQRGKGGNFNFKNEFNKIWFSKSKYRYIVTVEHNKKTLRNKYGISLKESTPEADCNAINDAILFREFSGLGPLKEFSDKVFNVSNPNIISILKDLVEIKDYLEILNNKVLLLKQDAIKKRDDSYTLTSMNELLKDSKYLEFLEKSLSILKSQLQRKNIPESKILIAQKCIVNINKLLTLYNLYQNSFKDFEENQNKNNLLTKNKIQEKNYDLVKSTGNNRSSSNNFSRTQGSSSDSGNNYGSTIQNDRFNKRKNEYKSFQQIPDPPKFDSLRSYGGGNTGGVNQKSFQQIPDPHKFDSFRSYGGGNQESFQQIPVPAKFESFRSYGGGSTGGGNQNFHKNTSSFSGLGNYNDHKNQTSFGNLYKPTNLEASSSFRQKPKVSSFDNIVNSLNNTSNFMNRELPNTDSRFQCGNYNRADERSNESRFNTQRSNQNDRNFTEFGNQRSNQNDRNFVEFGNQRSSNNRNVGNYYDKY